MCFQGITEENKIQKIRNFRYSDGKYKIFWNVHSRLNRTPLVKCREIKIKNLNLKIKTQVLNKSDFLFLDFHNKDSLALCNPEIYSFRIKVHFAILNNKSTYTPAEERYTSINRVRSDIQYY